MTVLTCPGCGSSLAPDQRYCVRCGHRIGDPFAEVAGAFATSAEPLRRGPLLRARPSAVYAVVALGTALLVGASLGPVVTGGAPANGRGTELVLGTGSAPAAANVFSQKPAAAITGLQAPSGNAPSSGGSGGGGGGGRGGGSAAASSSAGTSSSAAASQAVTPLPSSTGPTVPAPAPAPAPTTPSTQPTTPPDIVLKGAVVHIDTVAHRYVLATTQGQLIPVHADKAPVIARVLKARVKQLANGTFQQTKAPSLGAGQRDVILQGTITFADATTHTYTVSVRGASLFVHDAPDAPPPALNAMVTVTATLKDVVGPDGRPALGSDGKPVTKIDATKLDTSGQASGPVDIEAPVRSIDAAAGTLTLAADDTRESGKDVVVKVPAGIDVTKLKAGDVLDATVTIAADATYALTGFSHDETPKAADDVSTAQGDQKQTKPR